MPVRARPISSIMKLLCEHQGAGRAGGPPAGATGRGRCAFTLIELLVIVAIIMLLAGILVPSLGNVWEITRRAICSAHLRGMHTALALYCGENSGNFFPYRQKAEGGVLWYWGFEDTGAGAPEGARPIDQSKARLAPYITQIAEKTCCPSFPRDYQYLKPKFDKCGYGLAINRMMLAGVEPRRKWDQVGQPSQTVVWADSAQVNTWQAPASPSNPLIEEWYYLDNCRNQPANFHFRHAAQANAVFAGGSVRSLKPFWLDERCDGLVGRPEEPSSPSEVSSLLQIDK